MRTIALEEHYATLAFMEGPGRDLKAQVEAARDHPQVAAGYDKLIEQLCDLGKGRIAAMDAAGIDVQVLSLTSPGVEQLERQRQRRSPVRQTPSSRRRCGAIRIVSPGSPRCLPRHRKPPLRNWSARSENRASWGH
jgi:hypothetical protein